MRVDEPDVAATGDAEVGVAGLPRCPFTAQPITATSNASGYARSRSSTTRARFSTPTLSRAHDGHAIITGPRSRRPRAFRISHATSTSFTGSAVRETRSVSPMPSASRDPIPTELLIAPANSVPASVTPRCSGYGTFAAEHPVRADHRRHVRRLDRDLEVAVFELLEELDLLERRRDQRLGLVLLGERVEMLRERARVRADAHRNAGALGGPHHLRDLVRPADVPGVDADGRHAGVDRLEGKRGVEVDVRDDRGSARAGR